MSYPDPNPQPGEELASATTTGLTPRQWKAPWKQPFLEALSRMGNISAAARIAGVSKGMVFLARKEDEVFREAWEEALSVSHDLLLQIAIRRATTGEPKIVTRRRTKKNGDGTVIEEEVTVEEQTVISNWILWRMIQAVVPGYGARLDHHHSGSDGGPIQHEVNRMPSRERMLELLILAKELDPGTGSGSVVEGEARRVDPSPNGDEGR